MSDWYWRVIALKAAFILTCFSSYLRADDDNIQKLPFCNPDDAAVNDLVLVSTLDGKLTAFATHNGIKAWHVETQPLLSSNLHHVELTAGGKWVRLVPSLRGTLYSLSGENIEPLPFDAEQLLSSSFKYSDDLVIAGARETLWVGVDARTGSVVYECGSGGCSNEQQTAGAGRDLLVLRRHSSTVRALDPRTGGEKWNFSVAEHQVALNRRECAGRGAGPGAAAVAVAVALPEGVVAISRPGDPTPLWQQKLDAPVAGMWRLQGGSLQHIDVLWEATRSLVEGAATAPPSLYIGVHDRQLYIQESPLYAQKLETAVSSKPVPWKLMNSRPLLTGGDTALTPLENSDPNTLSLITLYGNTGQQGNHGFFLYLQETCDQSVQVTDESLDGPDIVLPNISDDQSDHHHVHVHVYSLWFWWKEVILIAVSSALLMNLMIWPRFFAPKVRPSTPLPINQECIIVERHYERPASNTTMQPKNWGRYETDFTPLRCLGKGAFGVVFEARNNIDHCSYAVKRITLPRRKQKRDRVLREVRALAVLDHEHIVRYFNAWVEEPPANWQEDRDAQWAKQLEGASVLLSEEYTASQLPCKSPVSPAPPGPRGRGDSVLLNIHKPIDDCIDALEFDRAEQSKRHRSLSCNDSFSVVYDENENSKYSNSSSRTTTKRSMTSGPTNTLSRHVSEYDESSSIVFEQSEGQVSEARECSNKALDRLKRTEEWNSKTDTKSGKKKKGHTRHWSLDMCVEGQPAASKMYLYIQMQLCCRDNLHDWLLQNHTWEARGGKVRQLFSQIVSAVEYVHRAGLMHRDLKPSNILFAPDGRVKVGDFGLATTMGDGQDASADRAAVPHVHTSQVGTELYMSPEQRSGKKYDYKVDIYSLGLIMFELYYPCSTDSERITCLRNVRGGLYPPRFHENHPEEVEVLKAMLSEDPARRPTAMGLRCRAPLYELPDERALCKVAVRWLRALSRGQGVLYRPNSVCTKRMTPMRVLREYLAHTGPTPGSAKKKRKTLKNEIYKIPTRTKQTKPKFIKSSQVIKKLQKQSSIEDNLSIVMSTCSKELLEYLVNRVNRNDVGDIDEVYADDLKKFAVTLHFYSPKAYEYIRKKFDLSLPDPRAISLWYLKSDRRPGITQQSVDCIKMRAGGKRALVCLLLNDIAIKEKAESDGCHLHGYVNVGNDLYGDYVEKANEALLVTAVAVNQSWKVPLAFFFGRNFTPTQKATLLKLCIDAVSEKDIEIISITLQGSPSNVNLAKVLGANVDTPPFQPYFTYNDNKYFLIVDCFHLATTIRRIFMACQILYHEKEKIDFSYIEKLQMVSDRTHLTNRRLAYMWHDTVAAELERLRTQEFLQFADSGPTVTFIRNFSIAFDTLLYKRCNKRNCQQMCQDYYNISEYIRKLKYPNDELVVHSSRKLCFTLLLCNMYVLTCLYSDYIKTNKLKYFVTSKLASPRFIKRTISAKDLSLIYCQFLHRAGVGSYVDGGMLEEARALEHRPQSNAAKQRFATTRIKKKEQDRPELHRSLTK
ncbi:eukaryotic translation initiation factor 2-alpha kinase-like [Pectinophora gossypiella]|uniref:eukaryotic translation initiation factor 2-alpha kinase-like n=1 Tax=Pectinophora gossypiella TaxID=13191 RepID=UPI00214F147F|nr:eukaryotic translation initiation factor 2-alpha kinase-like [Pectinophora gossypiella]